MHRDTTDLNITEHSLNPGTFIIALFLASTGFLVLHNETPYSLVNEDLNLFRTLWLSAVFMLAFAFNAIVFMFCSRRLILFRISYARFLQSCGAICLAASSICFIISVVTLCWSYSITSTLLHIQNRDHSILLTAMVAVIMVSGSLISLLVMMINWCINRNRRAPFNQQDPFGA